MGSRSGMLLSCLQYPGQHPKKNYPAPNVNNTQVEKPPFMGANEQGDAHPRPPPPRAVDHCPVATAVGKGNASWVMDFLLFTGPSF